VEDNQDDELLTLEALRAGGVNCEIAVARDGAEALDFLFGGVQRQPTFVLLDLKLPKVSGFEVLRKIRENNRTRLTPVVLLTSSSQEEDMICGYSAGANSFVRKPVQFECFLDAVRRLGQYWLNVNETPER
jgi:two-component system response regulator